MRMRGEGWGGCEVQKHCSIKILPTDVDTKKNERNRESKTLKGM